MKRGLLITIISLVMIIIGTAMYLVEGNKKHYKECEVLEAWESSHEYKNRVSTRYIAIVNVLEYGKEYKIELDELVYYKTKQAIKTQDKKLCYQLRGYDIVKLTNSNRLDAIGIGILFFVIWLVIGMIQIAKT